jgi:hypothetical protein
VGRFLFKASWKLPHHGSSEVRKLIDSIVNSQRVGGDTAKALEVMAGQILAKDQRIADLTRQAGEVPEDARARLEAYEVLGTPDELTAIKDSEAGLKAAEQQRHKIEARDNALRAAGYDPEKTAALALVDEYDYEVRSERATVGEREVDVQVAYARRIVDGEEQLAKVSDLLRERAGALEPALKAEPVAAPRPAAPVMGVATAPLRQIDAVEAHLERQRRARVKSKNPLVNG